MKNTVINWTKSNVIQPVDQKKVLKKSELPKNCISVAPLLIHLSLFMLLDVLCVRR